MDGMPKVPPAEPGEMWIYPGIRGPVLLNTYLPHCVSAVRVVRDAETEEVKFDCTDAAFASCSPGPYGFLYSCGYRAAKYVRFKNGLIALFTDALVHADTAYALGAQDRVAIRSAGFVIFNTETGNHVVQVYGDSVSLDRFAIPDEDNALLEQMVGPALFKQPA